MAASDVIAAMAEVLTRVMEGPDGLCVTFTVEGDANRWVQFVDHQVNMACAADRQTEALVAELGPAVIVAFEPGKYLTVTLATQDPAGVAAWIHGYIAHGLDGGQDFAFEADIEQL